MVYTMTAEEVELGELRVEKMKSLAQKLISNVGRSENYDRTIDLIGQMKELQDRRSASFTELFNK